MPPSLFLVFACLEWTGALRRLGLGAGSAERREYPPRWPTWAPKAKEKYKCELSPAQALEKNQQWLVYDQQREAFVQSVLARSHELEQQLSRQDLASPATGDASEKEEAQLESRDERSVSASRKDQLAATRRELLSQKERALESQAELRRQTERAARLQEEKTALQRLLDDKGDRLSSLQSKYEERAEELEEARLRMQTERLSSRCRTGGARSAALWV